MLHFLLLLTSLIGLSHGISNGHKATSSQFRYIASLRNAQNQHLDAGVLISYRFVLTTARIMEFLPVRVSLGSLSLLKGTLYDVEARYRHPGYSNVTFSNNVGLLRTRKKVLQTDSVAPIELQLTDIGAGTPLTAVGWGFTEKLASISHDLRWARFSALSDDECRRAAEASNFSVYYSKRALCVTGYQDYNQTWGPYDFGGPLVLDDTLVGIIFQPCMTNPECLATFPLMAYRVREFVLWVMEMMLVHEC